MPDAPLDAYRDLPFSYDEVGATRTGLPAGYRHIRLRADLGAGAATFDRAADLLLTWEMHRRAGIDLVASDPVAAAGTVVLQQIRLGPARLSAPCRVIEARRDPTEAGFTYGTLAGHPEAGEEAFGIEHIAGDRVVARITAFSRPGRWFTRIGGPVNGLLQDRVLRAYISALRAG